MCQEIGPPLEHEIRPICIHKSARIKVFRTTIHSGLLAGATGPEPAALRVKDLAAMIYATVNGVTLSDALEASGFKPVRGKRLVLEEGLRSETEIDFVETARQRRDIPEAQSR